MGILSKRKGARCERELAHWLNDNWGIEARRGQQYSGSPDSPDVVTDLEWCHIETKAVEKLNIWDALKQSIRDAKDKIPTVIFKRNRSEWYICMRLSDVTRFVTLFSKAKELCQKV